MSERLGAITRDEATKRVLKAIGRHSPRIQLFANAEGVSPIVVALPNEHVSEVVARVRAVGGRANVAVAYAKTYSLIQMGAAIRSNEGAVVVNQDLSMGMLLIKLERNPGKSLLFRFRDIETDVPVGSSELAYA